jgi:hypothetical protein
MGILSNVSSTQPFLVHVLSRFLIMGLCAYINFLLQIHRFYSAIHLLGPRHSICFFRIYRLLDISHIS